MDECINPRVYIITNETIYSHLFRNAVLFLNKRGYKVLNPKGDNEQMALIADYFLPIKPYDVDFLLSALDKKRNSETFKSKIMLILFKIILNKQKTQ